MTGFPRTGFLVALALMFAGAVPAFAKTLTFDQEKFHIEVPDDWADQKTEGNKISIINADQTKAFALRVVQTGEKMTLDNEGFIKGVEESLGKSGLTIINRQHLPVANVDAYVIDSTLATPSGTAYNRMIVFLANGYAYALNITKVKDKPWEDPELNGIVNSFGFIGTPELHKANDPAETIGYYIGMFIGVLAVISCFKLFLRKKKPVA